MSKYMSKTINTDNVSVMTLIDDLHSKFDEFNENSNINYSDYCYVKDTLYEIQNKLELHSNFIDLNEIY